MIKAVNNKKIDLNHADLKGLVSVQAAGNVKKRAKVLNKKPSKPLSDEAKLQIYWLYYYAGRDFKQKDIAKMFNVTSPTISKILKEREYYEKILSPDWAKINPYLIKDEWGKRKTKY